MPWKLAHCTDWRRTGGSQQIRIEDVHCKSFIISLQCHCSENLFDWNRLIASQCHCSENLFTFDNSRSGTRRISYDFWKMYLSNNFETRRCCDSALLPTHRLIAFVNKGFQNWVAFFTTIKNWNVHWGLPNLKIFHAAVMPAIHYCEMFTTVRTLCSQILDDVNLPQNCTFLPTPTNAQLYVFSVWYTIYFKPYSKQLYNGCGLPCDLVFNFMQKLTTKWKLHLDAMDNRPRFSCHAVQHALQRLPRDCVTVMVIMK